MDRRERFQLMGGVGVNQQEGPPMKRSDCTIGDYLLTPTEGYQLAPALCFCNALRQASRAVSRLYDEELRGVGLRSTQYSLLRQLSRSGEVRQRDLGGLASLDETTLTRNLRPLMKRGGWPSGPVRTAARNGSRSPLPGWRSSKRRGPRGSGRRPGCRRCCRRGHGRASWQSSRRSCGSRPGPDFLARIDVYACFCRGRRSRLHATEV